MREIEVLTCAMWPRFAHCIQGEKKEERIFTGSELRDWPYRIAESIKIGGLAVDDKTAQVITAKIILHA